MYKEGKYTFFNIGDRVTSKQYKNGIGEVIGIQEPIYMNGYLFINQYLTIRWNDPNEGVWESGWMSFRDVNLAE